MIVIVEMGEGEPRPLLVALHVGWSWWKDSQGLPSVFQSHSNSHLLFRRRWLVERGLIGAEGGLYCPVVWALRTWDFAASCRVWKATTF